MFARVVERITPMPVHGPDPQAALEATPDTRDLKGLPMPGEKVRQAAIVTPPKPAVSGPAEMEARMANRGVELGTPVLSGDIPISLKYNLSADEMIAIRTAARVIVGERCGFEHAGEAPWAVGIRLGIPNDIPACADHAGGAL